jgi:thiol-disulfide isomerase/thioredoxin
MVGLLVVCALAVLFWPRKDDRFEAPGLVDANGQSATLRPLLAPVTLVHFWATWCAPCMEEIPALGRLQNDFARYPNFRIVMVAVADSSDKVGTFLGSNAGAVLYDPDWEVAHRYGTDKIPESYLVVNDQIVEKFVGQTDWDDSALRQKLTARLAGGDRTGPTGT